MLSQQDDLRYKWDSWTGSGIRLRFDVNDTEHSLHVEDWNNNVVVDDTGCADVNEAVMALKRYCDIDDAEEHNRISNWLPARLR
jgi:hypothetical protein